MAIRRIYAEKRPEYAVEAHEIFEDIKSNLLIDTLTGLRIVNCYDVDNISDSDFERAKGLVFSEPPVDVYYDESLSTNEADRVFAVEFLPGQYDQRADSAAQCLQILTAGEKPQVHCMKLYILSGRITDAEFEKIKKYLINPVEAREAKTDKPDTLDTAWTVPDDVSVIDGFISMDSDGLEKMCKELGLAMDLADLTFCQDYFKNEAKRDPSLTEIRMIDTYWSDHCRHTTFSTIIDNVEFEKGAITDEIKKTYEQYIADHNTYRKNRPVCMMDLATIAAKALSERGILTGLDKSEEINACSIEVEADMDGKTEKWLVMFKNETHNHPTEIEPFGGAATCLGGAIRDPLSGRSYVYQAMRVTGCADPRTSVADTMPGKLAQRKLTRTAAKGYSSYGNQIGLSTGQVVEIYDPGYVAKRMEIGAVIGAAPKENVVRKTPEAGDVIILLGGKTGRDGCGGATGSSKAHTAQSLETCGAEVQKGNPPVERKIQRLFRNSKVTQMIKRCNDFGAGGVSVAIGELADGLVIDLDKVPKKYEGLDGTELAISESQERMAVVVEKDNVDAFMQYASEENLEATVVATVTDENRLVMNWRNKTIVDIDRSFLNTNGASKHISIKITEPVGKLLADGRKVDFLENLSDLNVCSQRGLGEMFDGSIGAASVLMPFGGKYQLTPQDGMAAKLPTKKKTDTVSLMTFGYNPVISKWSPYHGAALAVVESVAKIVALGGNFKDAYLTFQEYFEKPGTDAARWGKPFAALCGAYFAQMGLGLAAIGGKDSMSGSFDNLDVPPTLVSFAACMSKASRTVSAEFKKQNSKIVYFEAPLFENGLPDFEKIKEMFERFHALVMSGKVLSASVVKMGGICECLSKMAFGNKIGVDAKVDENKLYAYAPGSIVAEIEGDCDFGTVIGATTDKDTICVNGSSYQMDECIKAWNKTLEKVFPTKTQKTEKVIAPYVYTKGTGTKGTGASIVAPRVFIPVFPGTNCEYDTQKCFELAGAQTDVFVIKNLSSADIDYSLREMAKRIEKSQIVMLPGGFSGGDEPEGSGKFIAAAFRNPYVMEATMNLLKKNDGLMLGICNGFQALIKLGLVPYGEIRPLDKNCPTLTYNTIGRHVSKMVYTKVVSNLSPWLMGTNVGDVHTIAVSHGEGRFVANDDVLSSLRANGQIATQYVDIDGNPTYDDAFNPNGSFDAIEGITSPDGRVFGKMGHSERLGENIIKNVCGNKDQYLFESGVKYFG